MSIVEVAQLHGHKDRVWHVRYLVCFLCSVFIYSCLAFCCFCLCLCLVSVFVFVFAFASALFFNLISVFSLYLGLSSVSFVMKIVAFLSLVFVFHSQLVT
jgi:hypothetical protein